MSNIRPIASSLWNRQHIMVLAQIIAERLDAVHNLVPENRIYLIDQVNADALYPLAQQFDVLGYKGWFLAFTEEQRRALIRRAIELHRYKGTPWSVKEAIKQLGFEDVQLIERVGLAANYYDGSLVFNGSEDFGGGGSGEWATFSVIINLDGWTEPLTGSFLTALRELIFEYKGARNHLVEIIFQVNDEDVLTMDDVSDYGNFYLMTDELTGMHLYYDGVASHDGEYDYDETGDALRVDIVAPPAPPTITIEWDPTLGEEGQNVWMQVSGTNMSVDWGDGSPIETVPGTASGHVFEHTYAADSTIKTAVLTCDEVSIFRLGDADSSTMIATDVNFSALITSLQEIEIRGANIPLVDLSEQSELLAFNTSTNFNGENGVIEEFIMPTTSLIYTLDLSECALTAENVNDILIALDESGVTNGVAVLNQTPPAPPFGAAIDAIISLIDKGWTINWDV